MNGTELPAFLVDEAWKVANGSAPHWQRDPGELVGVVWEGMAKAYLRGTRMGWFLIGKRALLDHFRNVECVGGWGYGRSKYRRQFLVSAHFETEGGWDTVYGPLEPETSTDDEDAVTESQGARPLLARALGCLSRRDRQVVELYFGVGGGRSAILRDIGQALRISESLACLILQAALRRMREVCDCTTHN